MTAVAHVVERSTNSECPMSDNDDSDNAHELLQRLIVSKINSASQTPSDSSEHGNRQSQRTKLIKGKSWKCSGLLFIDILDPVPAAGDDVDMTDGSDHSHPLHSRLQIIKSLLQTFMRPFFPQDSLLEPFNFKFFGFFVDCRSLVQPRRGSTFHIDFRVFVQSSMNKTETALTKLIPVSSEISLSWALCEGGLGQNVS